MSGCVRGQSDDQVCAEGGGDAVEHGDGGYGAAGLEAGQGGLGHAGAAGEFGLGQAEGEAPLADRLADQERSAGLVVALAVAGAVAVGLGDLMVGLVLAAQWVSPFRSKLSWAIPWLRSQVCWARTARATSAVSAPRVLWNTVSSTSRRPDASQ